MGLTPITVRHRGEVSGGNVGLAPFPKTWMHHWGEWVWGCLWACSPAPPPLTGSLLGRGVWGRKLAFSPQELG